MDCPLLARERDRAAEPQMILCQDLNLLASGLVLFYRKAPAVFSAKFMPRIMETSEFTKTGLARMCTLLAGVRVVTCQLSQESSAPDRAEPSYYRTQLPLIFGRTPPC